MLNNGSDQNRAQEVEFENLQTKKTRTTHLTSSHQVSSIKT